MTEQQPERVRAVAVTQPDGQLRTTTISRRALRPFDVAVDVMYCGVCGSDATAVSAAQDDLAARAPMVPGHEFTGRVRAVGADVSSFAEGDLVAVSNVVDSCGECPECLHGQENYCRNFPTPTYGGVDRHDGTRQQGAWSALYVATEKFVHHLPSALDPAAAAPLMCAGITVWEPLRHWQVGPGVQLGVVGLGGLGHLAVKFGVALGAEVTVFTTSPGKADAARALGAKGVVLSSEDDEMAAQARRFDLILDTAAGNHDPSPFLDTLKVDGTLCLLGTADRVDVSSFSLRWGRHSLAGSGTGTPASVEEMLAFAAEHDVVADIEILPASHAQEALDRLARGDVRYRIVLDCAELAAPDQSRPAMRHVQ